MFRLLVNCGYISICIVIYNWCIHWWLPFFYVVFYLVPLMIIGFIVTDYVAKKQHRNLSWVLFFSIISAMTLTTSVLSNAASTTAEQRAIAEADSVAANLDINIEQKRQHIQTEEGIGDVGLPRHIRTTYELKEPLYEIEQKLYQQLALEQNWDVFQYKPHSITFYCPIIDGLERRFSVDSTIKIVNMTSEPLLSITIYYDSPFDCEVKE